MYSKLITTVYVFFLAGSLILAAPAEPVPVQLDFFFSAGCTECEKVKTELFPELEDLFEGQYELHRYDISISTNIPLLLAYQKRCDSHQNGKVSIVVDRRIFLSGYDIISTRLLDCVDEALSLRQLPEWSLADKPLLNDGKADEVVKESVGAMTLSVVAVGGLVDGLNPCAISTLIFFISVLALAKVNRRVRLMVGTAFILASFVVYTAMGLGFVFALRQAPSFNLIKKTVETCIGLGMIPLAFLSFRDAFRFRKSERPDDVTLQIPKKIKKRIHSYMNSRLGVGGPILGGLVTGAAVTILESVCTGQSYLPVLMYMLKKDLSHFCSWALLIIYNLLFVLPLIIVFICFHRGMEVAALINWSKRNLVITKILLGLFFTAMAVLLLL